MYLGIHILKCLKEELAWATDKWFRITSNIILSYTTKEIKNKAISSLQILHVLLCGS